MIGTIAGEATIDTISQDVCFIYSPAPLGGTPFPAATIKLGTTPLKFYPSGGVPIVAADVTGALRAPTPPCPPIGFLPRKLITPYQNKTVFFEKKLVAVIGDAVTAPPAVNVGGIPAPIGTEPAIYALNDRPLTGIGQSPKILIGVRTALGIVNVPKP